MASANDIIKSALFRIGVSSAINPASAATLDEARDTFYDWLDELNANGINLGLDFSKALPLPGDELGNVAGTTGALKAAFALRAATTFQIEPSPHVRSEATRAMTTINSLYMRPRASSYPSTLPIGAGNKRGPYGRTFYPVPEFQENYAPDGPPVGDGE